MNWKKYQVKPKKTVKLSALDTGTGKKQGDVAELKALLRKDIEEIAKLQNRLFAENRQSLLIVFQGMDSSGKDSAIKQIMAGVNPQGVSVVSFKHPSDL